MKYALYTGCVAKGAGRELLASTEVVCKKLGIELVEMTDAACCGAGVIGEDNVMVSDIIKPLYNITMGAFYGCYAMRPHDYSDLDNPDNPDEMERILQVLGAKTVDYPARLKCCGFPILMMNKDNSMTLAGNALTSAKQAGADCMVTQCPLCHLNMDAYQPEIDPALNLPVVHIQQAVGLALGYTREELRMDTHIIRPSGPLAAL
ncbi:MAG: CoB--CoM heterodisulfide reductase iron-sulfur subunit B family protein [Nitrospinae bacterium]|nr:CoB--CoM heterodisulfide reductase iron-sulfur subunit B family protein [Nitrospinota bacterium]